MADAGGRRAAPWRAATSVFHVAAKAGLWGPERTITAQRRGDAERDRRLPGRAACGGWSTPARPASFSTAAIWKASTSRRPIRPDFEAAYPETKADRRAARPGGQFAPDLATVALRPHLIWGPGDNNLCPGSSPGRGRAGCGGSAATNALIDPIYIDNAAEAHLLAADRLEPGSPDRRQGVLHHARRDRSRSGT